MWGRWSVAQIEDPRGQRREMCERPGVQSTAPGTNLIKLAALSLPAGL